MPKFRISSPQVGSEQGELTVELTGNWIELSTDGGNGDPQDITLHEDEMVELIALVFKHRPLIQRSIIAKCLPGLAESVGGARTMGKTLGIKAAKAPAFNAEETALLKSLGDIQP